ncbi:phosphate butyryltransferase [Sediminibacillus dalangtanensis]|uniref:Phosphate butyryltransferase n=1 Tax=Sediminibacillus dalangtanensis TaxID=2729421 RepID=A0ABX7VTD0_9BACI|nr:phosphate butyryltransferase [Sediminibacillus dalangtanensis]QTM99773.1 phosphate butyryltransferase [Sediminibacillus dalangtanensis]
MKQLQDLLQTIPERKMPTVAVVQAADKEVLTAVMAGLDRQLCQFILYGDGSFIRNFFEEAGVDIQNGLRIVEATTSELAAKQAVKDVSHGDADVVMKGNIDTSILLKAVLNKQDGLRTDSVLSHVALFEVPGREDCILLTDAAMNIAPDLEIKTSIVRNAVHVAKSIGIDIPKVAALAAVEKVNAAMPATVDAARLSDMQKNGEIAGCLIDGPLAFDAAVSLEAAAQKNIESDIAGCADILLVPSIETGNALYKSFVYFAGANVAAVIAGARAPIVLTSRSDTAENKLYSLALALRTLQ